MHSKTEQTKHKGGPIVDLFVAIFVVVFVAIFVVIFVVAVFNYFVAIFVVTVVVVDIVGVAVSSSMRRTFLLESR